MASTAASTLAKAVIITKTESEPCSRAFLRSVMPSILGIRTSASTAAGAKDCMRCSASSPSAASTTS
jgi:hypothetical protein